ncbi:SDE2 [Cordylochernes scorpioides]|uniref:SDE2 n=1 Tax=Cordylochernes scorpioides TaxID=51811 RepID=A0ABY6KFX8_9ARAC|nr:SDE2 [Cordylochernes scorpioides]
MSFLLKTYFGLNESIYLDISDSLDVAHVEQFIFEKFKVTPNLYKLVRNGKYISNNSQIFQNDVLHAVAGLVGGKGGFGSMLRAIGAQIEKTTNREACRDLSGRRLRDINEEERLKKWIIKQKEEKIEQEKRRREKLQNMLKEPKLEFNDPEYFKNLSEQEEYVSNAVEEGLMALKESSSKRKAEDEPIKKKPVKQARAALVLDFDSDEVSSDDSEDETQPKTSDDNKKKQ